MLGVQFIDVLACEGRYSFAFLKKFACKLSRRAEVLLSVYERPPCFFSYSYDFGMKICYLSI